MPRLTKEQKAQALLCAIPGCGRPWVTSFYGKRCLLHNERSPAPAPQFPSKPPARSWADPEQEPE